MIFFYKEISIILVNHTGHLSQLLTYKTYFKSTEPILKAFSKAKYAKLLLSNMKQIRDSIPLNMTIQDMCTGLLRSREQTTKSPLGKHLGIYKSLAKAKKYAIYTNYERQNYYAHSDNNNLTTASKCLHIQFWLMNLAISKYHIFN
jgi:hypothetical protein